MIARNDPRRLAMIDEAKSAAYRQRSRMAGPSPERSVEGCSAITNSAPRADYRVTFASGISVEITNVTRDVVEGRAIAFLVRERRLRREIIAVEELPEDSRRHRERLKQEPVTYRNLSTIKEI